MSTVAYPHIGTNSSGQPIIVGDRFHFKVRLLVEEYLAGVDAATLQCNHPQLTLSQIHSALAYYYDHKAELDQEIESLDRFAEGFRAQQGESPLAKKLRELGRELP